MPLCDKAGSRPRREGGGGRNGKFLHDRSCYYAEGRRQGRCTREFRVVGGSMCGRCSGEGTTGGRGGGWGRVEAMEHWSGDSREAEVS
jgi:hypothetical protein